MARKEFIQHSYYKFMFLIGIIDMVVLPFNAIAGGIQAILGYHYCAYPVLYFFLGVIPSSGWYGTGMTCLLLAINRFFETINKEIAKKLFGGKRIYIWLSLPFFYLFYTFFEEVATYQNKYYALFFDPFYGEPGWESAKHVNLTYHCIHNITIVIGLGGIYGLLCLLIATKSTALFKHADTSKLQKLMTLQSMCICVEIYIAAIVYVIMQFYTLPDILIIIAHACWICVHAFISKKSDRPSRLPYASRVT
uniref:Uncharacterized protein n=1 Tax=Acrobeloides nanus TaxID=290746 RepID=A0A914D7K2_9BILA